MWKMSWNSNCMYLICRKLGSSHFNGVFLNKFFIAIFTCTFASGGAAVGAIAGAIQGHMTETGLSQGLVAGAVTVVQLMDLLLNGEPFPTVAGALVDSVMNGEVLMEWVAPALLKAYQQSQSSSRERSRREEISEIFEVESLRGGLSQDSINELPVYSFQQSQTTTCCTICLHKMKNGEEGRWLGSCNHKFHLHCIDEWLLRHPTCPICRKHAFF